MSDSTCDRCNGTLQIDCDKPGVLTPCVECLSIQPSERLRTFAQLWLGCSPWRYPADQSGPWYTKWMGAVVPVYIPAGRDLLARHLARMCGLRVDHTAPYWTASSGIKEYTWVLHASPASWLSGIRGTNWQRFEVGYPATAIVVPSLSSIPDDAPVDIRAARALVLCVEHMEGQ